MSSKSLISQQPTALFVVGMVTAVALFGIAPGAAFGYASGSIAPDLFVRLIPWQVTEPVGTATVIGAFGGLMCGAALGTLGLVVQFFVWLITRPR